MAKNSSGGAADWKRRVEGDVIKLLGGQPRRADSARRFVDELLKGGIKRTTAARMVCASETDDPSRCAVTIPEKPRVSLAKSDRPLFQGEINWTKPRSDAKKKADSKSVPEPSAAPKAPLQVGQRVRVRTDRVVHFGPSYAGRAGTITKPNRVGGWYVRLDSVPRETVPKELLFDSKDLEVLDEPFDQAVADQYELRQQRARQIEQETERFTGDRYSPDLDATEISRRLRSEIAALIKSNPSNEAAGL